MINREIIKRYQDYIPEEDFNGGEGPFIASQIEKIYGGIENIPKLISKDNNKENKREEKIIKILTETPRLYLSSSRLNRKLSGVFGKIQRTGFEIGNYSHWDFNRKWDTYISLMKQFDLLPKKEQ